MERLGSWLAVGFSVGCFLSPLSVEARPPSLHAAVASKGAVWNAVAVFRKRVFLSGPRWAGSHLPALVETTVKGGAFRPFPDPVWNGWAPAGGTPAAGSFVGISALRLEGTRLWVVDSGTTRLGGDPVPDGPKLVALGLGSNRGAAKVERVILFGPEVAGPGSSLGNVRINRNRAYLTDAGRPGLVVVDLDLGTAWRVLNGHPSTVAPSGRPIIIEGKAVMGPDGKQLRINAEPLEVSPDRQWLYFGTLHGPWSKVPTRLLDDPGTPPEKLADAVEPWVDLPPTGGTAMDSDGRLYFSDLGANALRVRTTDGHFRTVVQDRRLHWIDAPCLAGDGSLWLPAAQLDRTQAMNGGKDEIEQPMTVFRLFPP